MYCLLVSKEMVFYEKFYCKKIVNNKQDYNGFVLLLSSESLFDPDKIDNIEASLNAVKVSDKILIDQLFITGDEENRFISCELKNGKLDLKTARVVCPEKSFRMETVRWLHDNYCYVENSILTARQRKSIQNNVDFDGKY